MTQRYVSVFSGAGGLDLGLLRAGFKPGIVSEESPAAYRTLAAALPTAAVMNADVHDLLNAGAFAAVAAQAPASLVAGSPPVLSGKPETAQVDPEGDAPQLLYRFLDVVAQARPDAFVMVTLPFLAGARWALVMSRLRRVSRDLGYDTFTPVIDAADIGLPQHRDRMLFIGMPRGCKPDALDAYRVRHKETAGMALRALHAAGAVRDIPCPAGVRLATAPVVRNSPYSGTLVAGPGRVMDLRKVAPVLPAGIGGNKTPVLDTRQLEHGEEPWIDGYHDYLHRLGGTPGKYGSEEAGVRQMRRLSLRECAALQGFPGDYPFRGVPVAQFKMVGTAVPPVLGEAAGRIVAAGLS